MSGGSRRGDAHSPESAPQTWHPETLSLASEWRARKARRTDPKETTCSRSRPSSLEPREQPVTVETINVPDPGPGEAVVKVQACGVCHTDLHYREGGINDEFPFLLGHEAAGVVESVGEGVTGLEPGDFVVLNWRAVCGNCRACHRGEPWYCFATHNATQKMTLEDGTELSPALGIGSFAEKTLVAAGQCTKVDPSARAAAVGLLGCGVMAGLGAALNTGNVEPRQVRRGDRLRWRRDGRDRRLRAGRRLDDHRRRHRRPEARVGPRHGRHRHRQLARTTTRSRRSRPSPTATAPTSSSTRSVAPRPGSRRSTPATSPAPSSWSASRRRT